MRVQPTVPGSVLICSKVYEGDLPPTPWANQLCSVDHAARMLATWAILYAPEVMQTKTGARCWFRDGHDINMLVEVFGATPAELRAAWRERVRA